MGAEEGDGRLAEVAIIVVFACAFAKVRGEGDCGTGKESIATLADSPAKAMAECFIGGKGHGFEKIMMDVAMMLLKTLDGLEDRLGEVGAVATVFDNA